MAVPLIRARSGTVIEPSSLGIVTEQADLSWGFHFVQRKDRTVEDRRVLRGGDAFSVDITANGGFAGIACPWHPGITTCYR